jgi:mono/diheme cytochrome c family protein
MSLRWVAAFILASIGLQAQSTEPSVPDAGGLPAPTPALERGRAVYVLNHCHFCHGTDLTRATMGAANLTQSGLVGADVDGSLIGVIVRAGLPNLQTAMPSYTELTDAEVVDLSRYVHHLRQQTRYRELSSMDDAPGDAAAGEAYFGATCVSCHSARGDLAGLSRRYSRSELRAHLLRPGSAAPADGAMPSAGLAAHLRLLENYTAAQVRDLVAYLTR